MKHLALTIVLALTSLFSIAQRQTVNNTNAWFMYFGDHLFSNRWGVHLEAQLRRSDLVSEPQQLLLRTGLNYHINNQAFVTLGYAFVETYPYGELPVGARFPEHRIWEQLQVRTAIGKVEMVNRLRLEQRWLQFPILRNTWMPGEAVYQNRARILNRFSIPFKGQSIEERSLYLSFYDEVMISFGKNVAKNMFDQNRAYIALGYRIPKLGRLEIGYMNQFILKPDGIRAESNHTLQVGLASMLPFNK